MRRLASLLLLVCAVPAFAQSFRNPVRLPISDTPVTALAGDLNGDGRPDLIAVSTTNLGAVKVHVLLAQASGGFKETASPTPISASTHCLLADVTRDNLPDVICGNASSTNPTLTVLPGKGDGSFAAPVVSPLTLGAIDPGYSAGRFFVFLPLAVADVNGNGKADLLVGTLSPGSVTVMFGDGKGGFQSSATSVTLGAVRSIAVADLNGDASPDLVAMDTFGTNGTSVLLNKGDGTFTDPKSYTAASLVADTNKDGHLDLLNASRDGLTIANGNSDGTFGPAVLQQKFSTTSANGQSTYFGLGPILSYGDRNHDGIADLLLQTPDGLTVLVGTNQPPVLAGSTQNAFVTKAIGADPTYGGIFPSQVLLDLDADGNQDIVSAGSDGLYATYGKVDGGLISADVHETGSTLHGGVVADFNGDGVPDVITNNDGTLLLHIGKGDGTFVQNLVSVAGKASPVSFAVLAHGDFNGDGRQDLLATTGPNYALQPCFLFGKGDGTFAAPVNAPSEARYLQQSWVQDFNKDGKDDFALQPDSYYGPQSVTIYLLGPNGTTTAVPTGLTQVHFAFGDLDGDGIPDLVTTQADLFKVQPGRGDGSFTAPTLTRFALSYGMPVLGDYDGDGRKDIALFSSTLGTASFTPSSNALDIVYNLGGGTFTTPLYTDLELPYALTYELSADLDGDGRDDLVFASGDGIYSSPLLQIRRGLANRVLSAEYGVIAGAAPNFLFASDLNRDGKVDLIAGNGYSSRETDTFTVLLNDGGGGGGTAPAPPVTPLPVGTSTALSVAPNPANVGQNVAFAVRITAPTQTVQPSLFQNATVTLTGLPGGAVTLPVTATGVTGGSGASTASANYNTSSLAPGTYVLTAHYSGNSDTLASDSPSVQLVVLAAATTATLTASPNPAYQAQTVHLSVTVSGQGTPDGSVIFLDGGQSIGSAALNNGTAALDIATLAVGTHTLTVHYGGSALFAPSDSNAVAEVILPSDFTLSADPGSLSMRSGRHVTVRITATSVGNFSGNLRFSTDTALPQYATEMILQPRVALSAGGTGSTSFYVDTDQVLGFYQSSTQAPARVFSGRGPLLALLCFVPGLLAFRRPRVRLLLLAAACTLLLSGLSGCGDHDPLATPPGDYALHVTAVSESSGQSHTLVVPLHITP